MPPTTTQSKTKIPKGWEEVEIGMAIEINPKTNITTEKFKYIDLEAVSKGELGEVQEINLSDAPSRAQRLLKKGDVLFQTVRPYQKNNYYFNLDGDFVASTGYAQLRGENSKYIFQLVHTNKFVADVLDRCTGSSYPAINSTDLKDITLLLPPLPEQQKIVSVLETWDKYLDQLKQKIKLKKNIKKGLMQRLLTGKQRLAGFDGEWESRKLGYALKLQGGFAFKSENYLEKGIPVIRISNISNHNNFIDSNNMVYYDMIPNESNYIVKKNDLLIAMSGATTGKSCIYNLSDSAYVNQRVGLFKPNVRIDNNFLIQFVFSDIFKTSLNSILSAGAQPNISSNDIESIKIYLPPLSEQKAIANILSTADDEIEILEKKLNFTGEQKKFLLNNLVSGRILTTQMTSSSPLDRGTSQNTMEN